MDFTKHCPQLITYSLVFLCRNLSKLVKSIQHCQVMSLIFSYKLVTIHGQCQLVKQGIK